MTCMRCGNKVHDNKPIDEESAVYFPRGSVTINRRTRPWCYRCCKQDNPAVRIINCPCCNHLLYTFDKTEEGP